MKPMNLFRTALLAAALLLAGYSGARAAGKTEKRVMPLISIEAIDPEEGTRFVTEPQSAGVSEEIASWSPGYVPPPEPYYVGCVVSWTETDGSVTVDRAEAQVKVRGNWTTNYEKKPLRIKFGEKQSLGGLNGGRAFKNWLLLAEYKDLSMLRNKAAFDLAHKILGEGLYCSDCMLVEVEINGEYWGVYLLAEQQEAAEGRVNVPEPGKNETGPYVGYLVEFDGNFRHEDPLTTFTIDYNGYAPLIPFAGTEETEPFTPLSTNPEHSRDLVGYTVKSSVRSEEQRDTIRNFISNVYVIMYSASYDEAALEMTPDFSRTVPSSKTPREAVEAVVDVQSLADMYILSEITCDPDICFSSFFMSADLSEDGDRKLRFEAPWDFDSALGNCRVVENATGFHAANTVYNVDHDFWSVNPWLTVMMRQEWFRELIAQKWTELFDSGALKETVVMIRSDSKKYKAAFTRNYKRWDNMADKEAIRRELNKKARSCRSEEEAARWLADWLWKRIRVLNGFWRRQASGVSRNFLKGPAFRP